MENGVVTAKASGVAVISVTTLDGNKTASCVITVKEPDKVYIYTESPEKVLSGKEFSYKIYLAGTYGGYSIVIPVQKGFALTEIKAAESGINVDDLGDGRWKISVMPSCVKVESEKNEIATVTVSVAKDAEPGDRSLYLENVFITDERGDMVSVIVTDYATITIMAKVRGDINEDGVFDYADVTMIYSFYRRKITVSDSVNTDINGDGVFDYLDVSKLYAIYRNKSNFN